MKKLIAAIASVSLLANIIASVSASEDNGTKEILCKVGDNLSVEQRADLVKENEALIANRPDMQRQMENIDRGLVAVKTDTGVFVSWRWLGTEALNVKFNLYRNGEKLNSEPLNVTNFTDNGASDTAKYSVSTVVDGVEGEKCAEVSVWKDGYLDIPVKKPANQILPDEKKTETYSVLNEASVADLDGDGQYEIVVKWEPRNAKDASKSGFTGNTYFDAYELDGTFMWRINMGRNIRSGPHDSQFIVYDFDNDGKAEVALRTADGTVAGDGTVIGDAEAKWDLENDGKNLKGPLYLTVFNGIDGTVLDTTEFYPQSTGKFKDGTEWDISSWGDDWGNRSERYLGGLGVFDGEHTSFIQARGYYNRTCVAAYHVENGKIVNDWIFESEDYNEEGEKNPYKGEGNHNLAVADIDYDGLDEVIYGAMAIDHDGTPMYATRFGHGDAQHLGDLIPSRVGMEVYSCHESTGSAYGFEMRDARTGEVIYGLKTETDNGRACSADIDPYYEGEETWSAYGVLTAADGTVISTNYSMPANFAAYWDGDLGREIQDGNGIYKWNRVKEEAEPIFKALGCHSINSAKSNPALTADIVGDWREDVIYPVDGDNALRIFTSTIPTSYRIPTLMHNPQYRNSVALQNVCYNMPTHVDYYLGYGAKEIPVPKMYTVDKTGTKHINSDLSAKKWSIEDLYEGEVLMLSINRPAATINNEAKRIDNDNTEVVPFVNANERTMVPVRFIAEALGAVVQYDGETKGIKITAKNGDCIDMTIGDKNYSISRYNGVNAEMSKEAKEMDTEPVVLNDRTLVPVRMVAEAFDRKVEYYRGLIVVSDLEMSMSEEAGTVIYNNLKAIPVPPSVDENKYKETFDNRIVSVETTTSNEQDANLVNDYDLSTVWTGKGGDTLTLDNGSWAGVPAVAIAFADNTEHKFRIEYSSDGEKWQIALANRTSTPNGGEFAKYYFGCPVYPRYVRFVSEDDADVEIKISEFAACMVE